MSNQRANHRDLSNDRNTEYHHSRYAAGIGRGREHRGHGQRMTGRYYEEHGQGHGNDRYSQSDNYARGHDNCRASPSFQQHDHVKGTFYHGNQSRGGRSSQSGRGLFNPRGGRSAFDEGAASRNRGRGRGPAQQRNYPSHYKRDSDDRIRELNGTEWPSLPATEATRAPAQVPTRPIYDGPVIDSTAESLQKKPGPEYTANQSNQEDILAIKRESNQPSKQKTKKHRPTLKNMSLGDVLPKVTQINKSSNKPIPDKLSLGHAKLKPKESASVSVSEQPRDLTGDEHALLRLLQDGKMTVTGKGRQRIRPRKKKFTTLKKRVLQERLKQWRDLHPADASPAADATNNVLDGDGAIKVAATAVCVFHFVSIDEVADDEEYEEFVTDLQDLAAKVGSVKFVHIPREKVDWANDLHPCFIEFINSKDAAAAMACWNGMVVGGDTLETITKAGSPDNEEDWRLFCLKSTWSQTKIPSATPAECDIIEVAVLNILAEDDFDDEDCLDECLADIRAIAELHGPVSAIRVEKDPAPRVIITYKGGMPCVRQAITKLNNTVISGATIRAELVGADDFNAVIIEDVLTYDDLEDEDCLEESLNDIRELAGRYGVVLEVCRSPSDGEKAVRITYASAEDKQAGMLGFCGMQIGGNNVSILEKHVKNETFVQALHGEEATGQLFSGDKRIPDRFAECKRVPKMQTKVFRVTTLLLQTTLMLKLSSLRWSAN
ncbi:hypothetical protein MPSEU_000292500 [Mayamaea pseudoterrestris]|nr:hypothetical protein MPSEU_000292500 [Mayamaea pseudoterrestris]